VRTRLTRVDLLQREHVDVEHGDGGAERGGVQRGAARISC
jgi:hypothetical protein